MGKARPYKGKQRGRRARYSSFDHQRRESEQRALRAAEERLGAHDPPHATGCLLCMSARMQDLRGGAS